MAEGAPGFDQALQSKTARALSRFVEVIHYMCTPGGVGATKLSAALLDQAQELKGAFIAERKRAQKARRAARG